MSLRALISNSSIAFLAAFFVALLFGKMNRVESAGPDEMAPNIGFTPSLRKAFFSKRGFSEEIIAQGSACFLSGVSPEHGSPCLFPSTGKGVQRRRPPTAFAPHGHKRVRS